MTAEDPTLASPATAPDELERLKAESEERLQNCAALVVENEQLRKDAERYRWLRKTTNWVSSKGQRINVRDFPKSWDEHIDDAMKDKQ